jgi:hypothetical protein
MNTLHLNDDDPKDNDPWSEPVWPPESPFDEPIAEDPFAPVAGEPFPYDEVETVYVPREAFTPEPFEIEPMAETVRKGGLAWSAGIALFGAVVFMLFLGWLADLILGSSPWGMVGGIIFGSLIGFIQFFRVTSRIFAPKADDVKTRPLFSERYEESNDDTPEF